MKVITISAANRLYRPATGFDVVSDIPGVEGTDIYKRQKRSVAFFLLLYSRQGFIGGGVGVAFCIEFVGAHSVTSHFLGRNRVSNTS